MKTILVLLGLAFTSMAFSAETESKESRVSFTTDVLSQYVDTDGQVFYDKPVVQSEISVSLGRGFYANIWHSAGLNMKSGSGNEIDTILGWSREGEVDIDVGISYFDTGKLFSGPANDVWAAYAKASKTFEHDHYGSLTPAFEVSRFRTGRGSDFEGGTRFRLSVEYSHGLLGTDFTYTPAIVKDDGVYGSEPAWVTSHEVSLSWKLERMTVKTSVSAYIPISRNSGRGKPIVYGVGIAF